MSFELDVIIDSDFDKRTNKRTNVRTQTFEVEFDILLHTLTPFHVRVYNEQNCVMLSHTYEYACEKFLLAKDIDKVESVIQNQLKSIKDLNKKLIKVYDKEI